jgi:hypothetical protein
MADRNRYTPRGRSQGERDSRSWREQEEQFSDQRGMQPDYQEGQGYQMSEPSSGSYAQRPADYESGWDRDTRYGQRGSGYGGGRNDYRSGGEYNYGPARYDNPGYRFGSFTSEDQGGRDFTAPTSRYGAGGPATGAFFAGGSPYGFGGNYSGERSRDRGRAGPGERNARDWWDRTSDEVMSWFGDSDATRRRQQDHRGRGPTDYTRSDDRIREDVNDKLTDDWGVDASKVTVGVKSGEVTLDGTVATRLQKRRAEDCAEDVSGVKHVQNNLRVQDSSTAQSSDRGETQMESGKTSIR